MVVTLDSHKRSIVHSHIHPDNALRFRCWASFDSALAMGKEHELSSVKCMAHRGLGLIAGRSKDYASAECNLQTALEDSKLAGEIETVTQNPYHAECVKSGGLINRGR